MGAQYPSTELKESSTKPITLGPEQRYVARVDPNPGIFEWTRGKLDPNASLLQARIASTEANAVIAIHQLCADGMRDDGPLVALKMVLYSTDTMCTIFSNFEVLYISLTCVSHTQVAWHTRRKDT